MSSATYATYTRPDGDEAVLLSDPLTRAHYERKGFTYVGPVEQTPGNEPQNVGRNGGMFGRQGYDATAVVKQAVEVVMAKLTGTYTEEDAAKERSAIRTKMGELGAFPTAALDSPAAAEEQSRAAAALSKAAQSDGAGAAGTPTDGPAAPDLKATTTTARAPAKA